MPFSDFLLLFISYHSCTMVTYLENSSNTNSQTWQLTLHSMQSSLQFVIYSETSENIYLPKSHRDQFIINSLSRNEILLTPITFTFLNNKLKIHIFIHKKAWNQLAFKRLDPGAGLLQSCLWQIFTECF